MYLYQCLTKMLFYKLVLAETRELHLYKVKDKSLRRRQAKSCGEYQRVASIAVPAAGVSAATNAAGATPTATGAASD